MSELVTLKLSFIKKTLSTDETMEESLSGVECYVLYDETDTDNGIYLSNITLTRYPNKVGAEVTDILDAIPHVDGYSNKIYGYIIEGSNELTLFCNIGNIDVLPNNIEITYPSYNSEMIDRIILIIALLEFYILTNIHKIDLLLVVMKTSLIVTGGLMILMFMLIRMIK